MAKNIETFITREEGGDQALLVQVRRSNNADQERVEREFAALAHASQVCITHTMTFMRSRPLVTCYLGSGQVETIVEAVNENKANVVLINVQLSPSQQRNLEGHCGCRVLDRTELILDIFAQRAKSHEGKLQVELAQLMHLRSRLVRGWTHLERQKGGIGLRGPGETQLETDKRLLDVRIGSLKKSLEKVRVQRSQGRRARKRADVPLVTLVGYTNAGKSTLFNSLCDADVWESSQLFATLDPTLRQLKLPVVGQVVLADTVGFIRDLPHTLVAAFMSTLEEAKTADLLLHVIDVSAPDYLDTMDSVHTVLKAIGADQVPRLEVMNKIDRLEKMPAGFVGKGKTPQRIAVCASNHQGVAQLKSAMGDFLAVGQVRGLLTLPPEAGGLRALLYQMAVVVEETIAQDTGFFILKITITQQDLQRLSATSSFAKWLQPLSGYLTKEAWRC